MRAVGVVLVLLGCASALAQSVPAARAAELVRVVRQDCGSCHGMRLTGGLGPALTREALADKPIAVLVATIIYGRTGTPMPGWRGLLSDADATWIAEQLAGGFPEQGNAKP